MAAETELERLVVRLVMKSGHKEVLAAAIRDIDTAAKDIKGAVKIMEASVEEALGNVVNVTKSELREAAAIVQNTRTSYEQFGLDMQRVGSLAERNAIGQDTYNRAVKDLRSTLPGVAENLRDNAQAAKEVEAVTRRNETSQESYLRQSKRLKELLNSGLSVDVYRRELSALQAKLPGAIERQRQLAEASREQGAALRRAASLVSRNASEHDNYAKSVADLQAALNAGTITSQQYADTVEHLRAKLPEQVAAAKAAEQAQRALNDQFVRAKQIVSNQTPEMRAYAQGIDDLQVALASGEIGLRDFKEGVERLRQTLPEQVAAQKAAEQAQRELNDQIARAKAIVSNQTPELRAYAQGIDDLQVALHQGAINERQFREGAEKLRQELPQVKAAAQELSDAIERGTRLAKSAESAQQKYEAELVDLRAALNAGEISQEQFNRALDKLKPKLPGISAHLKTLGDRARSVSQSFTAMGQRLSFLVTLPITAAGAAFVKLGSDAIETKNKFAAVFSEIQGAANEAANTLDHAYGLASTQSKQLLADTGDLLTGFGFSQQSALGMATEVQKLAADLASFTNIEGGAERASQALTSALLGEREAAKGLGIAILESDVQARVAINAAKGMAFANDRAAKAYATLQIAQEQSKNAIGDYGRTSKEFAAQFRELKNDIRDVSEAFGEVLMPIAGKALGLFRDGLTWVKGLSRENKMLIATLAGAAAAVGPLLLAVGSVSGAVAGIAAGLPVLAGIGAAIAPALPIIAGVAAALAVVGAAAYWLVGSDGLVGAWQTVTEATAKYGKMALGFVAHFRENMATLTVWLKENWMNVWFALPKIVQQVGMMLIKNNLVVLKTIRRLFFATLGWIGGQLRKVFTFDFVKFVLEGAGKSLGVIGDFAKMIPTVMVKGVAGVKDQIATLFSDFMDGFDENVDLGSQIKGILADAATEIKGNITDIDIGLTGPALNLSLPKMPTVPAGAVPRMPSIPTMDTAGATEAIDAKNEAMKQGAKLTAENRTALERFNAEKADLIRLLKVGAINQTTYQRAVAKAAAEYQNAVESIDKPTQAMLAGAKTAKEFTTPIETFNAQLISLKSQLASGAIGVDQFGRAATDAIRELNKDAIKEHGRLANDGAKVTDDFATPQEKYKKRMLELRELADTGAIDIETFGRATREAAGNLSKAMKEANAGGMSTGTVAHDVNSPEAWAAISEGLARAKAADAARNLAQREVAAQTSRNATIASGKLPPEASEATKEAMAAAHRGAAAMRAVENAKQEALAARGHIPRNPLPPTVTRPANQRFTPLQAEPLSPPSPKSKDGDQFAAWQRDDVVHVVEYLRALAGGRPVTVADV